MKTPRPRAHYDNGTQARIQEFQNRGGGTRRAGPGSANGTHLRLKKYFKGMLLV